MAKDPAKMSLKELHELEGKVKKAKIAVQERSRSELRQKLESIAAQAGFKLGELFGGRGGKGRKVAAKYANPDDPSGAGAAASRAGLPPELGLATGSRSFSSSERQ